MPLPTPKSIFEVLDGIFHNVPQVIGQAGEFRSCHRDISDDYVHGRLGVQINMEASNVFGEPKPSKYALVFEKIAGTALNPVKLDGSIEDEFSSDFACLSSEDRQPSVPIFTSKLVDDAKQDRDLLDYQLVAFNSEARLYALDPRLKLLWKHQQVLCALIVIRRLNGDREVDTVLVGNGIASYLSDCSKGQGIKSGTKLVKKLTEFKRCIQGYAGPTPELYQTCPVGFILNDRVQRICFEKLIPVVCKRVSMHFGPVETLPAFRENARVFHGADSKAIARGTTSI